MADKQLHDGDPAFEDFVENELPALRNRALEQNICVDCLTDRFIVEMVASLTSAGVSAPDILSMVEEGMRMADEAEGGEGNGSARRVH
ncbi:hypothetical protein [Ovoidimarina sediminis]|uniref:hypothetical protein n=1 Tax=Ovoidimarina sediminis TaxID=3079856 RepID=UPI0029153C67|nr:hypothetical protein [Rhodophyticola sp. MJ-SS7]MDU8943486.1 hypothetical protein [Rhodophyticola sp. MJ-SS7]